MRYAVTGAAGFIGSHLVARLKEQGHWVRAIDHREVPERAHRYGQADQWEMADLRDGAEWALAPKERPPRGTAIDRVYHLAADHGGAGYFHSDADGPAARNNMQIDLNVLRACEENGVERLFYASSFCAYPTEFQDSPHRLCEEELQRGTPEQCYGSEKLFMTQLCEASTLDARCGIFATIYGPGQEYEGIRAKFPTAITKRIIEARDNGGPVELWGDGSQIRTFLFIEDALDRIQAVMGADAYEGPVNIASDEQVSVMECALEVADLAGLRNADFAHRFDKPTGVAARVPNNDKFDRLYGLGSPVPMREGFRRLYEWMNECLPD